jgi:DNA-binding transcriptional MerR regulator
MIDETTEDTSISFALAAYQPEPNILYSLDTTAHLAGVSRRALLVYCRRGLVQPILQPPNGAMMFTDQTIYTIRRIEYLRAVHDNDLAWINTVVELLNEVEHLRAELRFFRDS